MKEVFKQAFSHFKPLLEILEWTLKLYCLTLVIPFTLTIVGSMIFILGIAKVTYLDFLNFVWIKYYFTGKVPELNIPMWRVQLVILFICFLINVDSVINRKYDKIRN